MTSPPGTSWAERTDALLGRPTMQRATVMMAIFAAATAVTGGAAMWLIGLSGDARMSVFAPIVGGWIVTAVLSWGAIALRARTDSDADRVSSRALLTGTAVVYVLFGVGLAHSLGFWANPFTLMAPSTALIVGIVFGPRHGWIALATAIAGVTTLEVLRVADVVAYAPAALDRSIDSSADGLRVVAAALPLTSFAISTVALAFAVLAVVHRQREALAHTHELIRTYVPAQVADAVLEHGTSTTALERRKLTIFFSDVVGFTEVAERSEPEDLARVLDDYFSAMTRIAERHDGTIDELIGDAVLIFFGAPTATTDRDHALRAVRMAVEMQDALRELNATWARDGIDAAFEVRMGVNTGVVTVGDVGTGHRRKYAALGRAVNLAARVQAQCRPGRVLVSRATWLLVQEHVPCTPVGEVELKGIAHPVPLYEVDA